MKTNIGKTFLKLVSKHFPQQHKYHTLFNMNNIKVSYSCMENMGAIINKHNKKILSNNNINDNSDKLCNCRSQQNCPLDNKCLTTSLFYNAQITSTTANQTTTKNYIGLTEELLNKDTLNTSQHSPTGNFLIALNYQNTSGNSKTATPALQLNGLSFRARPYHNSSKRCDLCLAEKLHIIKRSNNNLLNKRSELVSKCRHENKFYLKNN